MSRAIEQRERDERNKRRHQHQHAAAVYLDPLGTNTPITGTGNPHRGYRLRQQHSQELANQYAQTAFNRAEAHRHHQEHTVSGHDRDLPSEYRSNQFLHADDGGDFPPQRRHFSTSSSSTTSAASTTSTASSPGLPVPESDQQEVSTLPVPGDQVVNSELDLSGQPITNNDLSEWVKLQSYTESNHTIADGNEEIERSGPSSQPLLAEREGPPDSPHPSRGRRPSPVGPRRHSRSRSLEPRLDGTGLATISSRNGTAKKGTLAPSLSPRSRPSTARNSILVSTASIPLRDALASSTSTGSVDTVVWLGLNNEKRDDRGSRQAPPQDYFSLRIDNRQDREELEGCSGSSGGNSRGTVIWQRERERERDTVTPTPASIRSSRSSRSYGTPFGGGTPHRATLATPPTLVSPSGPDAMVSGSRDVGSAERGAYSRSSTSNSMKRSPGPSRPQTPSRSEVTAAEAARLAAARAVAHVYQRDRKLEQHGSM
ncbi:hypothetical protein QBC46DRAFT_26413 [Diplogelasinospora grovesii]|uniref:Uncharacterized protein n=1 Tax=Diplogelasinospora grovesii TaxID=303347 RepID=A0AAN6N2B8_9PEZI|nr:hypothetical protein QBC46DRAFT_26413 [Diplogelasinospora grovesii]